MVFIAFGIILIAAALPAFIWLIFFLCEDAHPEPRKLLIAVFFSGAFISIPVLSAQVLFEGVLGTLGGDIISSMIGLALIEEIFKFFAAFTIVRRHPAFDEPVDAMIYMIVAALGFATVENFFITVNSLSAPGIGLTGTLATLILRFVGATLLHTLSSGLVGYHWARGMMRGSLRCSLMWGIVLATAAHTVFNYLILRFQDINLLYPSLFLVAAAFFILNDFEKLKT